MCSKEVEIMDGRMDGNMDHVSVSPGGSGGATGQGGAMKIVISLEEATIRLLASAIGAALASGTVPASGSMQQAAEASAVTSGDDAGASVARPLSVSTAMASPLPIPADRPPAVDPKASVLPDALICLEDGHRLTMLKRYLRSRFGLTPEQYRARWGLPLDYPMVAPRYAMQRSDIARRSGLGRNGRKRREPPAEAPADPVDVSASR